MTAWLRRSITSADSALRTSGRLRVIVPTFSDTSTSTSIDVPLLLNVSQMGAGNSVVERDEPGNLPFSVDPTEAPASHDHLGAFQALPGETEVRVVDVDLT